MFDRVLKQIREKTRIRHYVMSLHAEEEMDEDGLTIYDVERVLLTGKVIERQKDKGSSEWKYVVNGNTFGNVSLTVVCKLGLSGKLIILTVYLE